MVYRIISAATVLSTALVAQQVTTSVTALSTLTCTASVGGTPTVQQLPAGPLPSSGFVRALAIGGSGTALAVCQWGADADAYSQSCAVTFQGLGSDPNAAADVGPVDLLVEMAAPTQVGVSYTLEFVAPVAITGSYAMSVDVDNDGVVDWSPSQSSIYQGSSAIGPQPLAVRLTGDLSHMGLSNGGSLMSIRMTVVPDLDIDVDQVADGCAPGWLPIFSPGVYSVRVPFLQANGGDVDFELAGSMLLPVQVLGLSSTPTSLVPLGLPAGCLGIPSPDLVRVQPLLSLPIPAAVRPVVIYAQAFSLDTNPVLNLGIASSPAYRVSAY